MKMKNTLLLAGTVAAGLAFANPTRAALFLSPRALDNQISRTSDASPNPNSISGNYLGAAAKWQSITPATVSGSSENQLSLVSGNYLGAAARDTNRELRGAQSEAGPTKAKMSHAGCAASCCQKK
jgi:hypothetical protein